MNENSNNTTNEQSFQMLGQNLNLSQPPKKSNTGLIIGIAIFAVILFVVLVAVVGVLAMKMFKPQDDDIQAAMENTFSVSDNNILDEVFQWDELQVAKENGTSLDMNIRVDELQGENIGCPSLKVKANYDKQNSAVDLQGDISAGGITVDGIECYYDTNSLILSVPGLYDKAFELDYSGNFEDRLRKSTLAYVMTDEDSIQSVVKSIEELKASFESAQEESADFTVINDLFSDISDTFFASAKTERLKKEVVVLDGKDVKCQGYRLTLDHDGIEEVSDLILDGMKDIELANLDSFKTSLNMDDGEYEEASRNMYQSIRDAVDNMDSFTMDVYLYKGQVARIDCHLDADNGNTIEIEYESDGGEKLAQNMTVVIFVETEDTEDSLMISRITEDSDDAYSTGWLFSTGDGSDVQFDFSYDREDRAFDIDFKLDDEMEVSCKGTANDAEGETCADITLDKFEVINYGTTLLKVSGDVKYSAFSDGVVKPSGDTMDVLEMSEYDWMDVYMEVADKLD